MLWCSAAALVVSVGIDSGVVYVSGVDVVVYVSGINAVVCAKVRFLTRSRAFAVFSAKILCQVATFPFYGRRLVRIRKSLSSYQRSWYTGRASSRKVSQCLEISNIFTC